MPPSTLYCLCRAALLLIMNNLSKVRADLTIQYESTMHHTPLQYYFKSNSPNEVFTERCTKYSASDPVTPAG